MKTRSVSNRILFLAVVMAVSLTACGDDDGSGSQTEQGIDAATYDTGTDSGSTDTRQDDRDTGSTGTDGDAPGSDTGGEPDAGGQDTSGPGEDTGNPGEECSFTPDPSLAADEPAELSGMTALHNKWRERVGVARLSWNSTLAASAKAYAQECFWGHSSHADRNPDAGYQSVGENLTFTTQRLSAFGAETAVQLWIDERVDWDFGMNVGDGDFAAYGHYTQVVWHSTEQVGCGAAYCSNVENIGNSGTVVVCRYGPAGNYTGRAPYEEKSGACLDLDNDDTLQGDDADDLDRTVQ
jgi:uncharacterized protein YkwD